jgi:hypothetical protein
LLITPLLKAVIFLFRQSEERAMLWTVYALYIPGRMEVAHVLVSSAETIVLGL